MNKLKNSKLVRMFMLLLTLVFFTSVVVATSISKYVTEENAHFFDEDKEFEHLDYTVNAVFVVRNQEELFAAINQGYTYVQLDKDIENPLIVTQKAETLNSDLILDLNGIEIQRNGYDPILNIKPGVRLTVVDTSSEQTGGLYNPVGSVFNIYGGTLTVVTGTFESGPRYSEYYSYNNGVLRNQDDTKRTIVENSAQAVNFYVKNGSDFKLDNSVSTAPIIKSYPEKTGEIEYNHGNLYFDSAVTKGNLTIKPDTYCYYRTSEDRAADATDISMADWYYTYFVDVEDFSYAGATVANPNNYIEITIYGYENVIKQAAEKSDAAQYHAAIQMTSGTLDVQDGGFFQYFGVDKTACVNAQGGEIKIKKGDFSSRVPNATSYVAGDVIVKEIDEHAFDDKYFNNFNWYSLNPDYTQFPNGNLAKQGESYCILNGGSATVTVGTGNLYSSNNNIISMEGGELSISGGQFTKRLTPGFTVRDTTEKLAKHAAINMQSGTLGVANASCFIYGDKETAILMENGILTVDNTNFNVEGESTYGIYSMIDNNTDFNVTNSSFDLQGALSTGIYAERGAVNVSADSAASISVIGDYGKGIHVKNGGSVISTNYSYSLAGSESIGILAESDATGINVTNGSMNIVGSNTFGIKSSIVGDGKFIVENLPITMTGGDTQTGIFAENGSVQVSADNPAKISTSGTTGRGIHVINDGSVISTNYSYSLSGSESIGIDAENGAKGINVSNGSMTIKGDGSFGIRSYIVTDDMDDETFKVVNLPITMTDGESQTGIFAQNGRVNVSADEATISINDAYGKGIHVGAGGSVFSDNYYYELKGIRSHGIYSTAGTVSVSGGDITLDSNDQCYGVYAFSATEKIKVDINGAEISVGYGITNNKTSDTRASVGVFLATNDNTNKITLTDTDIKCYEVGVLIDGGSLDVKSTTATANEILTRKASSIIVKGGSITFDESCNYNITSSTTVNNSTTNEFDITLPTVDEAVNDAYANYDGIYVNGGDFTSNGNVDITHTGLYNDTPSSYDYNTLVVKSYAVRILGGNVNILKGNITALIGGGIYSGASGSLIGDITMGNESSALSDITVRTNGNSAGDRYNALGTTDISESWRSNKSITGGHAIELNGGNISVYNGTYEAQFGNGVAANSSGRIEIYNGIFNGWMNANGSALDGKTGPSAFYGLKVVGGAQVVIKGGTFDGGNGGAFVTGVTEVTSRNITETSTATVLIYAGTFGSTRANLWDAFNIYDDAIVVFGAGDSNYFSAVSEFNNAIKLLSGKTSIAVNRITQSTSQRTAYIYVYYGDYSGGNMWNDGNGDYETYNTRLGYTSVTGGIGVMNNTTARFNTITI